MSTSAQVESAWEAAIWEQEAILNYTDKIHLFGVTEDSEKENESLYSGGQINFIQALTSRAITIGETSKTEYTYAVEVSYFMHKDPDRENWTTIRDFFDALYPLVVSELGNRWTNTVDFWRPQSGPAVISEITIDGESVWKGTYTYQAFKRT